VVVDRDRQHLLGHLLADDELIEAVVDLAWLGEIAGGVAHALLHLLPDDVVTELDALVADEDGGPGDELSNLVLALAAERAVEQLALVALTVIVSTHRGWLSGGSEDSVRPMRPTARAPKS
jgi:hypothetical protein